MTGVLYELGDRENVLFSMTVRDPESKRGRRRTKLTEYAPTVALYIFKFTGPRCPFT